MELGYGFEIEIEYDGYSIPAKVTGPPEDCYPADGSLDWEIVKGTDYLDDDFSIELSDEQLSLVAKRYKDDIEEHCWDCLENKDDY